MGIADEARAEARTRYRAYPQPTQSLLLSGFERGAEWQASRKPEAAPSDTDQKARAEYFAQFRGEWPAPQPSTVTAEQVEAIVQSLADGGLDWDDCGREGIWGEEFYESVYSALDSAGFSRTSQPAQVEVTADALSAEDRGILIDALIQHRDHALGRKATNSESTSDERAVTCSRLIQMLGNPALSAALGGGE